MLTAKKFHITEKGDAKPCRAYVKGCPITAKTGGDHYNTKSEAQAAYEQEQSSQSVFSLSKKKQGISDEEVSFHRIFDITIIKYAHNNYHFLKIHRGTSKNSICKSVCQSFNNQATKEKRF